jgi:hypothetical protein
MYGRYGLRGGTDAGSPSHTTAPSRTQTWDELLEETDANINRIIIESRKTPDDRGVNDIECAAVEFNPVTETCELTPLTTMPVLHTPLEYSKYNTSAQKTVPPDRVRPDTYPMPSDFRDDVSDGDRSTQSSDGDSSSPDTRDREDVADYYRHALQAGLEEAGARYTGPPNVDDPGVTQAPVTQPDTNNGYRSTQSSDVASSPPDTGDRANVAEYYRHELQAGLEEAGFRYTGPPNVDNPGVTQAPVTRPGTNNGFDKDLETYYRREIRKGLEEAGYTFTYPPDGCADGEDCPPGNVTTLSAGDFMANDDAADPDELIPGHVVNGVVENSNVFKMVSGRVVLARHLPAGSTIIEQVHPKHVNPKAGDTNGLYSIALSNGTHYNPSPAKYNPMFHLKSDKTDDVTNTQAFVIAEVDNGREIHFIAQNDGCEGMQCRLAH